MATNLFRTCLQQVFGLENEVKKIDLEIRGLFQHSNMISFNNSKDPYDNLTGKDHADALALYDALDIYDRELTALCDDDAYPIWINTVLEILQHPLNSVIASAKQMLEPIAEHPSAYAKMARFYAGVQDKVLG